MSGEVPGSCQVAVTVRVAKSMTLTEAPRRFET